MTESIPTLSLLSGDQIRALTRNLSESERDALLARWFQSQDEIDPPRGPKDYHGVALRDLAIRIKAAPHIGAAIKILRELAGISQAGLSKGTSLNQGNLSSIESGKRPITESQLEAILDKLQAPPIVRRIMFERNPKERTWRAIAHKTGNEMLGGIDLEMPVYAMIRFFRMRMPLTQEAAAERCSLPLGTYQELESPGKGFIKYDLWEDIRAVCKNLSASDKELVIVEERFRKEKSVFLRSRKTAERTNLGQALTELRLTSGHSQPEIADAIGMQLRTYQRLEATKHLASNLDWFPSSKYIYKLARFYKLDDVKTEELAALWEAEKHRNTPVASPEL